MGQGFFFFLYIFFVFHSHVLLPVTSFGIFWFLLGIKRKKKITKEQHFVLMIFSGIMKFCGNLNLYCEIYFLKTRSGGNRLYTLKKFTFMGKLHLWREYLLLFFSTKILRYLFLSRILLPRFTKKFSNVLMHIYSIFIIFLHSFFYYLKCRENSLC